MWYPEKDCFIERNIFINSGGISTGHRDNVKVYVTNNVFIEQSTPFAVKNWASYETSETIVEYNSFLSPGKIALKLPPGYSVARLDGKNNFWDTNNTQEIEGMIIDRRRDLNCAAFIEYIPFLRVPHVNTPAL